MKGQIISPKKQMSRASDKSRDKEKDKDKSSLYSGTSTNSSRLYLQGENASSRSFASAEYDSQTGRPRSLLQAPLYGKGGGHGVSPDDMSDEVSLPNGHRHWNGISNPGHRYNSMDFGNNDEQADIDIIDAIFSKEDTPPSSPLHAIERKGYFDHHAAHHHAQSGSSLHPHSSTSEVSNKSHHHSPAQALAFLHRSKDKHGKGKIHTSSSTSQLAVEDTKGRKRVSSAPSKSIFGPLRSNSKSTTQLPTPTEQDTIEVHGAGNSYHHHHHHHHLGEEDEMRPVLVHIPTRQEPIDVHSHPFRWKGKPGPSMQSMSQVSHGVHGFTSTSSLGGDDSGYAINDEHIHRLASVNIGSLEHEHDSNEHEKRKMTGSGAAHIFKNPFKNRSTSMLSTSSSVQSVPVSASAPQQQQAPVSSTSSPLHEEHHIQEEKDNEDAADMPRGSLDLQKTLRPSMEGDPSKIKMRRMTSPAKMTPAEEADLQLFIKQSVDGHPVADTFASAFDTSDDQLEHAQAEDSTRTTSRREQARRQSVSQLQRERERELDRRSQRSSGRDSVLSSHTSSSRNSREASLDKADLVRQPTNEEELDERARRLRERGLLPTLSITTSDDLPARPPKLTSYI